MVNEIFVKFIIKICDERIGGIIIKKELVGIAAEFAVASELGRRNVFAQPTFGHLKRTDLLVASENGRPLRIEVKGKQGNDWPGCKGIPNDQSSVLVLVDFKGKNDTQRPDFYILTFADWKALVDWGITEAKEKHPNVDIELYDKDGWYYPIWKAQHDYRGMGLNLKLVEKFKEQWDKITMNLEGKIL